MPKPIQSLDCPSPSPSISSTSRGGSSLLESAGCVRRRDFLGATAALAASISNSSIAQDAPENRLAFFLVGDTHYLANENSPNELTERSHRLTSGLVDTLNALPGTMIPDSAGGGTVAVPQGLIHAGDLIDSGDKQGGNWDTMQQTEWEAYCKDFGVNGTDGRLQFPVYEVYGNHDGPQGNGLAIDGIVARNKQRKSLTNSSPNGLHVAWDWDSIHFVNLGIVVGQVPDVTQRRRYDPKESLNFLISDLRESVGQSGRPVILTHHIDVARYAVPCDKDDPSTSNREWHPCDVKAYYNAIREYNVVAIFHGHTHVRNILAWDGTSTQAQTGISVFNVDNASHFKIGPQAFMYFEIGSKELVVRECASSDDWETFQWTPQVWRQPIRNA